MESETFNSKCPYCLAPYENLKREMIGHKARCVKCQKKFIIKEDVDDDSLIKPSDQVRSRSDKSPSTETNATTSQFAPESAYDESLLLNSSQTYGSSAMSRVHLSSSSSFGSASSLFAPKSTDSYSQQGEYSSKQTLNRFVDYDEYRDCDPADFDGRFPDPPKGVWRAGEILLDGLCQVLPLTPNKLYAEGGVGYVQRVRRRDWNIDLIVKSPKPKVVTTESGKENFERECQTWIELGLHANIVSCYFVRRIDGVPRLFAELAPDGTLRDWISDKRIYDGGPQVSLARLLDISIQFAWGLEHAHSQGLLHLDVKPGNVMTSGTTIKVTDFGLSKFITGSSEENGLVESCEGMTPSYCSPEQLHAFRSLRNKDKNAQDNHTPVVPITRQSDIWSWAISVLAMFHGNSPCKKGGETAAEVFELYLKTPKAPSRPIMPPRLVQLMRWCFQKNPADRPESMQFLADQLVEIYEESTGESYPRRQPQNAALTAESFCNKAISLLDLGKTQEALRLLKQANDSKPNHPQILFNRTLAQWRSGQIDDLTAMRQMEELTQNKFRDPSAFYALGLINVERGNLKSGLNAYERALEIDPHRADILRSAQTAQDLSHLDSQCVRQFVLRRKNESTPPSLYLADDGDHVILELVDRSFVIIDVYSGSTLVEFPHNPSSQPGAGNIIALSADHRWSLSRDDDNNLVVESSLRQEFQGGIQVFFRPVDWNICRDRMTTAPMISKELNVGSRLVFKPKSNSVDVFDDDRLVARLLDENHTLTAFSVTDDGEWVATGYDNAHISIWNVAQKRRIRTFQRQGGSVEALWFDPRKRCVISITQGNSCQIFSVELLCAHSKETRAPRLLCLINSSEELMKRQTLFENLLKKARQANNEGNVSKLVEAYQAAKKIEGWESYRQQFETLIDRRATRVGVDQVTQTLCLQAHEGVVSTISVPWNGAYIASAGKDSVIRVWKKAKQESADAVQRWSMQYELNGHYDWVRTIALSPDGRFLVSASWDQKVYVWDLATGRRIGVLPESVKSPAKVSFAPDGRTVALATANGNVVLWDLALHKVLLRIHVGDGETRSLVFSRDGRTIVTSTTDSYVRFWNGRSVLPIREIGPFPGAILSVDLSCDGTVLIAGCANGKIYCSNLVTNEEKILSGHLGEANALKLFPDGRFLVSSGKDNFIRFWNLDKGVEAEKISNPDGEVVDLALDLSGANLVVGSENGFIRQWNIQWNYEARPPQTSPESIESLVFSLAYYHSNALRFEKSTPSNYYGLDAVTGATATYRSTPLSKNTLVKIYAECLYRGLTHLSFDDVKNLVSHAFKLESENS